MCQIQMSTDTIYDHTPHRIVKSNRFILVVVIYYLSDSEGPAAARLRAKKLKASNPSCTCSTINLIHSRLRSRYLQSHASNVSSNTRCSVSAPCHRDATLVQDRTAAWRVFLVQSNSISVNAVDTSAAIYLILGYFTSGLTNANKCDKLGCIPRR